MEVAFSDTPLLLERKIEHGDWETLDKRTLKDNLAKLKINYNDVRRH